MGLDDMKCPDCYNGFQRVGSATFATGHKALVHLPCTTCEGCGIVHCCEGLQSQPSVQRVSYPKAVCG